MNVVGKSPINYRWIQDQHDRCDLSDAARSRPAALVTPLAAAEPPLQPELASARCFTSCSHHPPSSFRATGAVTTLPGEITLFPSRTVVAIANALLERDPRRSLN